MKIKGLVHWVKIFWFLSIVFIIIGCIFWLMSNLFFLTHFNGYKKEAFSIQNYDVSRTRNSPSEIITLTGHVKGLCKFAIVDEKNQVAFNEEVTDQLLNNSVKDSQNKCTVDIGIAFHPKHKEVFYISKKANFNEVLHTKRKNAYIRLLGIISPALVLSITYYLLKNKNV